MVKYSERAIIIVLLLLFNLCKIYSQELGNPISNLNTNEFNVSFYMEKVWREMDDSDYSSYRIITKTEFGFNSRFKIFGLLGGEKMYIDYPVNRNLTNYKGKIEFAVGGGMQMELLNIKKTSFFTGTGILETYSRGSVVSDVAGQIDMKFDWREYWFALGASHETKRFEFYGGIETRRAKRLEKISEEEYVSKLKPNLFTGIDILLPKNFVINVHLKTLDQSVVSVGISQRSIGKLK